MPFTYDTTLLYFEDGKVEVYNITFSKYCKRYPGALFSKKVIEVGGDQFIASKSLRNTECYFINMELVTKRELFEICWKVEKYGITIQIDKIWQTYIDVVKSQAIHRV